MDKQKKADYISNLLSFCPGTKGSDTAKLLSTGKSLNYLMHLDEYTLIKTFGCSEKCASFLRLAAALTSRRITDKCKNGKKYLQNQLNEYICGLFFGMTVETVCLLTFDKDGKLISSDYLGDGTVNSSGFLPRKMLDVALRKNAASVILAHNHPCGKTEPSGNDISATALANSVLSAAGIKLTAHYIVSGFELYDCLIEISDRDRSPITAIKLSDG